jgi:prophage antirepressor-like protein
MNQELTIYKFKENPVRLMTDEKGDPWFVANDAGKILELSDTRKSVNLLDEDERKIVPVIDSMGRQQSTFIISEAGLYKFILKSTKPQAKDFQRWVTHEVLPSIRKTGAYVTPGATGMDTLQALKVLIDNQITLEQRMDKYEAKQQAVTAVLEPVKEVPVSGRINQVVRDHAFKYELPYRDCWHKLYYEFKYRYNVDLLLRATNRGVTGVQIAEELGMSGELLGLAIYLFTK